MINELIKKIDSINDIDDKIKFINEVREQIHKVSPLKHHPVDFVKWVKSDSVEGNEYNPNHVDRQNMKLLITSIIEDGYTMCIVGNPDFDIIKIVDGYHRRKSERTSKEISKSTYGYLPMSFIRKENRTENKCMASTIRHNRARGKHEVELMSEIVIKMVQLGWDDSKISEALGMDSDEVLRLKQLSGISEVFKNVEYTKSWEFKEI